MKTIIKSSPLNHKAHNLLKGAATVVAINPRSSRRVEMILSRSNSEALASDWKAVGEDIRSAMTGALK